MAIALTEQGPFSVDKFTLTATTAADVVADRTFTLDKADFIPTLPETLEVLIDGVKLKGDGSAIAAGSGDEFYVNSATDPTTMTIETNAVLSTQSTSAVTALASGNKLVIRRLSNRGTKNVDYAPGSVIREVDLDNSNIQILHVAQEAIDISLSGMVLEANDKFDGKSKKIENVADGVADSEAVNKAQLVATEVATLAYKEDTEDYKLETADWATKVNAVVNTYTDNVAQTDGSEYSAKEYAQGSHLAAGGSAKNWSQLATTPSSTATDASAKEWATGTSTHKNDGSAKAWAQDADAVDGIGGNNRSAKAWSQGASMTGATLGGSSKDWASTLVTAIDGTLYSAKENATGVTTALGSAKQWALGGGSFVEGTVVAGGVYSAKKYASDASASETAAANSAAAVSQVYDTFNDVYLGSMRTDKSSADGVTLTEASWAKDSSSIAFTGTTGGTVTIGQELTTTGTGYPLEANIIGTQLTTPIVISKSFTVASPSPQTLAFAGTGVYGAFNASTGGPSLNNDGDALINGNLYFNAQENEMRIWQGAEWIAATAVGQASLLEYKFVTNANQIDSGHAAYKTYVGAAAVGGTLSYTQDNILVFMNGVQLKNTTDYAATNGSSVVLVVAPVLNDEINIIAFKSFTTADMVSKGSGGTFAGAVTFGAGLTGALTGNASGTSATVTTAAQPAITSVGTLTAVTVTGAITANGGLETDTNSKIIQKGAFMQSSTHQALTLGG